MPTFVLTYRMPRDYVPRGPQTMASWAAWFDSMGGHLPDRGNPVFESAELGDCGLGRRLGGTASSRPRTSSRPSRWPKDPRPRGRRRCRGRRHHGAQSWFAVHRPRLRADAHGSRHRGPLPRNSRATETMK
jgi:hypothetical protein